MENGWSTNPLFPQVALEASIGVVTINEYINLSFMKILKTHHVKILISLNVSCRGNFPSLNKELLNINNLL